MAETWKKIAFEDDVVLKGAFGADSFLYAPTAGTPASKTTAEVRSILNVENGADVTDPENIAGAVDASTAVTAPADSDTFPFVEYATGLLKKLTWSNIKATFKSYFDTLYATINHNHKVGSYSTGVGDQSFNQRTTGDWNVAVGYQACYGLTSGQNNVAVGPLALGAVGSASNNAALGVNAGYALTGGYNVAVGNEAIRYKTFGSKNVGLGFQAGTRISDGTTAKITGNYDIFIGANSKGLDNSSVGNEIVIGYDAVGHGANTVTIGNDDITDTYLKGKVHGDIPGLGFKNKIIGGDFSINPWQKGTSFTGITTSLSGETFPDRFKIDILSDSVLSVSKAADPITPSIAGAPCFSKDCFRIAVTTADTAVAAGDHVLISHMIEGLNAMSFGFGITGSEPITLSFWVKTNKPGTYAACIRNSACNRSYVAEFTVATTGWEKKVITIPVDSSGTWLWDTGIGLIVGFTLTSGTNYKTSNLNTWQSGNYIASANQVNFVGTAGNTFALNLVQLEAGVIATPFENRPAGVERSLCERYFWRGSPGTDFNQFTTAADQYTSWPVAFPVTMRAIPSVAIVGATGYFYTDIQAGQASIDGCRMVARSTGVSPVANVSLIGGFIQADAEL